MMCYYLNVHFQGQGVKYSILHDAVHTLYQGVIYSQNVTLLDKGK